MKVLVDTNVILDVLYAREPFVNDASLFFKYCELDQIDGYVSALTVPNIVYVMRKELARNKIRQLIETLTGILTVSELRESDLTNAAKTDIDDYEDSIQSACASRIKADFIVTRNLKDFKNSRVPAISPSGLLERLHFSQPGRPGY